MTAYRTLTPPALRAQTLEEKIAADIARYREGLAPLKRHYEEQQRARNYVVARVKAARDGYGRLRLWLQWQFAFLFREHPVGYFIHETERAWAMQRAEAQRHVSVDTTMRLVDTTMRLVGVHKNEDDDQEDEDDDGDDEDDDDDDDDDA